MFEQDYIIRQIKECVAAAMKLIFGYRNTCFYGISEQRKTSFI